jgi:NSS family neurotransmitter:Na+ symporter
VSEQTQIEATRRGAFSSRKVFILAAIGSAVGLGNIWRFPYVAYENGGGAFIIPYLVALLLAGVPFLFLDYALGHRNRGSAPLSFARLRRGAEGLGWWQVMICFLIAVYYAAVIAWSVRYTFFSVGQAWGDDPEGFFFGEFLQAGEPGVQADLVPGVLVPLLVVWAAVIAIMVAGVQKGIGATSVVFIPVLFLAFGALVVRALFLPGAGQGLAALFSPNWGALAEPGVWGAAFGQIFFSLSIGFGIMITYASYVHRDTDMSGSGAVVGFANSSFELLAGIGVFAALGFMAQASGLAVSEVASGGIGLAFIAFPVIISEAPAGALIGLLFFGSLVISLLFFSTTSGIYVLDIVDHFINQFGILLVAVVSMLVLSWVLSALPVLADHLNHNGSIHIGGWWRLLISVIAPVGLGYVLVRALVEDLATPYGGYPQWMLLTFGWGMAAAAVLLGFAATRVRWRPETSLEPPAHALLGKEGRD